MRVEHVEPKIVQWGEQPKIFRVNTVVEGSASAANGAIANADMIQERIDLKSDASTMAGAFIGLLHIITLMPSSLSWNPRSPASVWR